MAGWPNYGGWGGGGGGKHHGGGGGGSGGGGGGGGNSGIDYPTYWGWGNLPIPPKPVKEPEPGAKELVTQFFEGLQLGALADWAWQKSLDGASFDQILALMRTDPYAKPIYDSVFPGMAQLAQQGRAMTEGDYLAWEHSFQSLLKQYGVPEGIYDTKANMAQIITSNLDLPQLQGRLQRAAYLTTLAPQDVRDAYAEMYGASSTGALIAAYMDPDIAEPVLEKRYGAANAAGAARANNLQGLDTKFFEDLSSLASEDAVWEAAAKVARERDLYDALAGEAGTPDIGTGLMAGAGQGDAQKAVEAQRSKRLSAFAGGGGLAESDTGVSGLSSAQR